MIRYSRLPRGVLFAAMILQQLTAPVFAEDAPPPGPPPPPPEARQFDFRVGDWEVSTPDGKVAGHNKIELIPDNRVLQENWSETIRDAYKAPDLMEFCGRIGWYRGWLGYVLVAIA